MSALEQLVVDQADEVAVGEGDRVVSAAALASPEIQLLCLFVLRILLDSAPTVVYPPAKSISPLPPWMIA
jgi:hypothetical protein